MKLSYHGILLPFFFFNIVNPTKFILFFLNNNIACRSKSIRLARYELSFLQQKKKKRIAI